MRAAQQADRDADRRFAVRIRIAVPHAGFGDRLNQMQDRLDQNAGADGWALTPSGIRGIVNDAIAIYFADVAIASAFVTRWCRALGGEVSMASFGFVKTSRHPAYRPLTTKRPGP
jgi:hypothetical protein